VALKDGTPENYGEAAIRHYEDAKTLREGGGLDNAGHLVGFAAECAIKHKIGTLGAGAASLQLHLPDILPAARKRLGERSSYASMFNLLKGDVFSDWAVDHRYAPTGKVTEQQMVAWLGLTQRLLAAAGIRVRRS
jgi:hypothetical protein